jgi:hypothetical protein
MWREAPMRRTLPKEGDLRVRRGFLLNRKTIDGEERWLEWASWTEEYKHHPRWPGDKEGYVYWTLIAWGSWTKTRLESERILEREYL